MYNYEVYFDVFGKKLKTTVLAKDEVEAKQKVIYRIKFDKVIKKKGDDFNEVIDMMNNVLNPKK